MKTTSKYMLHGSYFVDLVIKNTVVQIEFKMNTPYKSYCIYRSEINTP